MDRASLHDLVLDFAIALHTEEELTQAHQKIVNAFREQRTVSPYGVSKWDRMNMKDPATFYVLNEIIHHARNAIDMETVTNDSMVISWLTDQPQDSIVQAVAAIIGVDTLTDIAAAAKAAGDTWIAACAYGAAADEALGISGRDAQLSLSRQCMSTFYDLDMGDASSGCTQEEADQLELDQLCMVCMGLQQSDLEFYFEEKKRHEYLLTTKAARASPQNAFLINLFGDGFLYLFSNIETWALRCWECIQTLKRDGVDNSLDEQTSNFCTLVYGGLIGWFSAGFLQFVPGFRWSKVPMVVDMCREAALRYEYDIYHIEMVNFMNKYDYWL